MWRGVNVDMNMGAHVQRRARTEVRSCDETNVPHL